MEYTVGLDFGTDSVRAALINIKNGEEISTGISPYSRWREGKYCDPEKNQYRQHPLDFLESMEEAVRSALQKAPPNSAEQVVGLGVDTTGSTPVAIDEAGVPLSLREEFSENPNAMFILWKDHTAIAEAEEINRFCRAQSEKDYTCFSGGVYSSEWFFSKILHTIRKDQAVARSAYSWLEHCDWISSLLCGTRAAKNIKRSRCSAGHKALWHASWGGLPPESFFSGLDSRLAGLRSRLFEETFTSDVKAGGLSPEWAKKLGLPLGISVAVGAIDAHLGAVGAGVRNYGLCKVMGTSTCDIVVAPQAEFEDKLVAGICGQVDGSVIPGLIGMEAGQSAFGDVYAWLKKILLWPMDALIEDDEEGGKQELAERVLPGLTDEIMKLGPGGSGLRAIDWFNGRRTPYAQANVKATIHGFHLGTTAPQIFHALLEATAFGSKAILDRFIEEGVRIDEVIALGGIAKKSPLLMQMLADILNRDIKVCGIEQTCALGAAITAAVAAGKFSDIPLAQSRMASPISATYSPNTANVKAYKALYQDYLSLAQFSDSLQ